MQSAGQPLTMQSAGQPLTMQSASNHQPLPHTTEGKSLHDVLFFYKGGDHPPSAARMGCWKAHWATASGMGPCSFGGGVNNVKCPSVQYSIEAPLLFNVCIDPSESIPLAGYLNGTYQPQQGGGWVPFVENQDPTDGRPTVALEMVQLVRDLRFMCVLPVSSVLEES
jgi:hypothetical protein